MHVGGLSTPRFLIHLGGYISVKVTKGLSLLTWTMGSGDLCPVEKSLKKQWELLGQIGLERRPLEARQFGSIVAERPNSH